MLTLLMLLACGGEPTTETGDSDDGSTDCGASEYYDVTVIAQVEDAAGVAMEGVEVGIEERNLPREFGSGVTDAAGRVEFVASQLESVPGCWGLLLNYWIVARCDGADCAEDDMNTELYNAIDDGTLLADVSSFPLVVE